MAARLVQRTGWGGLAGYRYLEEEPCEEVSVMPHMSSYEIREVPDGEGGLRRDVFLDSQWHFSLSQQGDTGFCLPRIDYSSGEPSVDVRLMIDEDKLKAENVVSASCSVLSSQDSTGSDISWTCGFEALLETDTELEATPSPNNVTIKYANKWSEIGQLQENVTGCGNPYRSIGNKNTPTPPNKCKTLIVFPYPTTGWNCPNHISSSVWSRTLPAGHDYYPAPLLVETGSQVRCNVTEADLSTVIPQRSQNINQAQSISSVRSSDIYERPLLPSLTFPPVEDPAPHAHIGWTPAISHTPLGNTTLPYDFTQGTWTAGKEMSMRARWISGGVQTELDGSLSVQTVFGERTYITQARSSNYAICGLSFKISDMCFNDYGIPAEGKETFDEDSDETYSADCTRWFLAAGPVCESWSELLAHAYVDGVILNGSSRRNAQEQYTLRAAHCTTDTAHGPSPEELISDASLNCRPPTATLGNSLHQYGYAVDVAGLETRNSNEYAWLATNAWRWGWFNLSSEPWHWSTTGA